MSSTNKTSLGLNMWEASDKPVRQDFVNDNTIIDEKITNVDSKLDNVNSNLAYTAKTNGDNTFIKNQYITNGLMGVDNSALSIIARTDQNIYSRPSIYLDCYGTVGGSLFLDTDGQLKLRVGKTMHTINMT